MPNFMLDLSYDGTRYRGWQRLKDSEATVQGKVEQVLSRLTAEQVQVIGCGRTDAGVHAESYIANFHLQGNHTATEICQGLDAYLPEDIVVRSLSECAPRFHARYHVLDKTYIYRFDRRRRMNPFTRRYRMHCPEPLALESMREAALIFLGEHDFRCFTTERGQDRSLRRTIFALELQEHDNELCLVIRGDGFLWNMVRIIGGTLLDIGRNPEHLAALPGLLSSEQRILAAAMLPAQGLFLHEVRYQE